MTKTIPSSLTSQNKKLRTCNEYLTVIYNFKEVYVQPRSYKHLQYTRAFV